MPATTCTCLGHLAMIIRTLARLINASCSAKLAVRTRSHRRGADSCATVRETAKKKDTIVRQRVADDIDIVAGRLLYPTRRPFCMLARLLLTTHPTGRQRLEWPHMCRKQKRKHQGRTRPSNPARLASTTRSPPSAARL